MDNVSFFFSRCLPFDAYPFLGVLFFAWGACIGSFLNVCVYRIPRELSVVVPRSFCPHCNQQIRWYHNVPILSYVFLKARCAYCGGRISCRYALIELLVAVLFLMVWLKFQWFGAPPRPFGLVGIADWKLVPVYWLMLSGLVLGMFVDFEFLIIPDRVTLGGIIAGLILSFAIPSMHGAAEHLQGLFSSAIGAATGWGILWLVAVLGKLAFKKDAMGFGDVKLLGAIGAFLGWRAVLFTIMGSSFLGSLVGITLVLSGKRQMQSKIPYGPYISLAAILWVFWGSAWWARYIALVTTPR